MKKLILSLALGAFLALNSMAQTVYLKDSQFEGIMLTDGKLATLGSNVKNYEKGTWFFAAYNGFEKTSVITTKYNTEREKNVISFTNAAAGAWYYNYLGQRIKPQVDKGIYRLSFWAKGSLADARLQAYIKINGTEGNKFFIIKGIKANDANNPTIQLVTVTNKWIRYAIDFDFSQTSSATSSKDKVFLDATDDDYKDCFVGIQNNSANSELLLSDIVLSRMGDSSAMPNNLIDPGFENPTTELFLSPSRFPGQLYENGGTWGGKNLAASELTVANEGANNSNKSMKLFYTGRLSGTNHRGDIELSAPLINVEPGTYDFSFFTKSDIANINLRLDFYVYETVTGTPQGVVISEATTVMQPVTNFDKGYKVYKTTTDWTKIEAKGLVIPTNAMVAIIFRPNVQGVGSNGLDITFPINYWFDDFSFAKAGSGSAAMQQANALDVKVMGNTVVVENATENIDVYDFSGRSIMTRTANENQFTIAEKGFYIVKCGNKSASIAIQ